MLGQIKIALCGCGHIAAKHLEAIKQHTLFQLIAIVDPVEDVRKHNAHQLNVLCFSSLEELLESSVKPDIVSLCTPSGLHAQQTKLLAEKNIHIITEKPLATNLTDGKMMLDACKNNGVNLYIVHQLRYNPYVQALKHAIETGRFGKLYMVSSQVFWTRPQSYFDSQSWRGSKEMDGGAYLNQACHFIDLFTWLFGDLKSVQAMFATLARNIEAEDSGVINLKWKNGMIGNIAVTLLAYPKNLCGTMTVLGENGTVILGGAGLNELVRWEFAKTTEQDAALTAIDLGKYPSGHAIFYEQILNSLHNSSHPVVTGEDGYKTLEIIMAAHRASDLGVEEELSYL